ncbi:hypothetical protein AB0H77_26730 [Streptomyces sp. NPDC050844]|uniref:hypothetical protein n=1 Tax=Streptomyces sp. NPDC050844 TaxID=3155790 RepID=UPI0033DF9402
MDVHDDASGRRRETVQRLGAALTTLKRERGAPSYDLLHRRGIAAIPGLAPMSRSSISELLAGKHGPRSLDPLLWLVRLLLAYQDGEEVAVPEQTDLRLQPWRDLWVVLESQSSAARRRPPHPVADSATPRAGQSDTEADDRADHPEALKRSPAEPPPPSAAEDEEAEVALHRFLDDPAGGVRELPEAPASSWRTPSAIWGSPGRPRCSRSRHSPEPASAPVHLVGRFPGPPDDEEPRTDDA